MNPIQIITDSTAYLTRDYRKAHDIVTVPLYVNYKNTVQLEGAPGEYEAILEDMKFSKEIPKTSTPSIGDFQEAIQKALDQGKDVLVITVSKHVSATFQSAQNAARLIGSDRVAVVDSGSGAGAVRFLLEDMWGKMSKYTHLEQIVVDMKEQVSRIKFEFTVASLEYLARSGRLGAAQAMLGELLKVRPIIQIKNGYMDVKERVRGTQRAIEKIMSAMPARVRKYDVCHVIGEENARMIFEKLKERFPHAKGSLSGLGPVYGAHLGPGAVGVCYECEP